MDLNLKGKVALVTGSSRGIGFSIAYLLAQEGCKVVLNGRNKVALQAAAKKIYASQYVVGDVTTEGGAFETVEQTITIHGQLDILICNVGSGASLPPGTEDMGEWLRVFGLNLLATTNTVFSARPYLSRTSGVILCMSSICGLTAVDGAPVAYSASKAALNSFVTTSSRHLAKEKIRINALAPGNILFEGSSWEQKLAADQNAVTAKIKKEVALGRFGQADEVASMAVFLCSDRASFATGSIFVLDGGQL